MDFGMFSMHETLKRHSRIHYSGVYLRWISWIGHHTPSRRYTSKVINLHR